jgi:uncharacterized protein YbjQ (UPF0145 family)
VGYIVEREITDAVRDDFFRSHHLDAAEKLLCICHDGSSAKPGGGSAGVALTPTQLIGFDKKGAESLGYGAIAAARLEVFIGGRPTHWLKVARSDSRRLERRLVATRPELADFAERLCERLPVGVELDVDEPEKLGGERPVASFVHQPKQVILSTTAGIEGHQIRHHLGLVACETVLGLGLFKDIEAGVTDVLGGRSGAYERELGDARESTLKQVERAAVHLGASAVVGLRFDYEALGSSMLMLCVTGTAVALD